MDLSNIKFFDIGAGGNPNCHEDPEWIHNDIRPLPHIEVVSSADKLPLQDNSVKVKLFARYVIEHFPYSKVADVFTEWIRIMDIGCELEFHTLDIVELNRQLEKKYIGIDWYNKMLFGSQNYDENFHQSVYTFEWYKGLLEKMGLKLIQRSKQNKWENYERTAPYCPIMVITAVK